MDPKNKEKKSRLTRNVLQPLPTSGVEKNDSLLTVFAPWQPRKPSIDARIEELPEPELTKEGGWQGGLDCKANQSQLARLMMPQKSVKSPMENRI